MVWVNPPRPHPAQCHRHQQAPACSSRACPARSVSRFVALPLGLHAARSRQTRTAVRCAPIVIMCPSRSGSRMGWRSCLGAPRGDLRVVPGKDPHGARPPNPMHNCNELPDPGRAIAPLLVPLSRQATTCRASFRLASPSAQPWPSRRPHWVMLRDPLDSRRRLSSSYRLTSLTGSTACCHR